MKWIIFGLVVIGIFGAVILLNKKDTPSFSGDASKVITEGSIGDHVFGANDQKVVLIEYGDYQCPGCAKMAQPVKDLTEKYKDKLTFIFRHIPLTSIHPNALAAATAAEAAGQQGKFWEMHDLLYANQSAWRDASASQRTELFESLAAQAGADVNKYRQDLTSKAVSDKLARDRSTAKTFGVDQTPTFILNGTKLDPTVATNEAALVKAVEAELDKIYPGTIKPNQ